jgi:hypothetical protein
MDRDSQPEEEREPEPVGLTPLRATAGWPEAVAKLREMWAIHGDHAKQRAAEIADYHAGRRGLMVVDVVLSNQRRYDRIVTPLLNRWREEVRQAGGDQSLKWLVDHPLSSPTYPLRRTESATIANVALGLLRFGSDYGLDEDEACTTWAMSVHGLELAPKLDPYVGAVSGIGPALFAYTRILCGADTIKPDVRVIRELQSLGVALPSGDPIAGFVVAACMAYELRISLVELDQLLWYAQDRR